VVKRSALEVRSDERDAKGEAATEIQDQEGASESDVSRKNDKALPARARDRNELLSKISSLEPTDPTLARIVWCWEQMTNCRWVPGKSHVEGAEKFGVSVLTMRDDATEASHLIRLVAMLDEDLKEQCVLMLLRAAEMAERAGGAKGADAIANVVRVLSGLKGFDAPKKLDVGGTLAEFLAMGAGRGKPNGE
jgi:hypothetical protein